LDGQQSEAAFDWKEGDVRERRFLKYSFLDEDHITEYLQTGYAFNATQWFLPEENLIDKNTRGDR